jgi:sulfate permease, SulP family
VYEVNGPFFFGAAERFKDTVARVSKKPRVLIIRMRHVPAIDATAIAALRDVVRRSRKDGTLVLLSDIQGQPLEALSRAAVAEDIGMENVFPDLGAAMARATEHVGIPSQSLHVSRWG